VLLLLLLLLLLLPGADFVCPSSGKSATDGFRWLLKALVRAVTSLKECQ